jgi:hypothetical protein
MDPNEGTNTSQDVLMVPDQLVHIGGDGTRWRYGTIGQGHDLSDGMWSEHEYVFSSQRHKIPRKTSSQILELGAPG